VAKLFRAGRRHDQKQASLLACYLRLAARKVDRLDFEKQEDER
jgi:hypothetical protein